MKGMEINTRKNNCPNLYEFQRCLIIATDCLLDATMLIDQLPPALHKAAIRSSTRCLETIKQIIVGLEEAH